MAARILQLALWLTVAKWTARAVAVVVALIVFLFCGVMVVALQRGQSPRDAFLTAFVATAILIVTPFTWIARGQLPPLDL